MRSSPFQGTYKIVCTPSEMSKTAEGAPDTPRVCRVHIYGMCDVKHNIGLYACVVSHVNGCPCQLVALNNIDRVWSESVLLSDLSV